MFLLHDSFQQSWTVASSLVLPLCRLINQLLCELKLIPNLCDTIPAHTPSDSEQDLHLFLGINTQRDNLFKTDT